MTTSVADYTSFIDKKAIVQYNDADGIVQETEGLVEMTNAIGLLLKPKGKSQAILVEADNIVDVIAAPVGKKKIKPKYISKVDLTTVRQHLGDRHGVRLADLNGMTNEQALSWHDSFDHDEMDLAHRHGVKPPTTARERAIHDAEAGKVTQNTE